MVRLHRSVVRGQTSETGRLEALVHELIERIAVFPTPWGIRIGLAARGIDTGSLPLPLTPRRRQQIESFNAWFPEWLERL
jgi:dihydrodipicolinate synthase/N-acetylneuraminate lyase